jgi:competence protein CoiA
MRLRGKEMPLRCYDPVAGTSIQAFDLSNEKWRALESDNRRNRHLRMPCCHSQVVLRRSKRGVRFFAHKAVGECTTRPESEPHLRLKQMVVEAARANGWTAETEVTGTTPSGEAWRADVLAQRRARTVAVEIQWSSQTNEDLESRQKRYADSNIRCLWIMKHPCPPVSHDFPTTRVCMAPKHQFIAEVQGSIGEQRLAMQDFLSAVFRGRFRFGAPLGFPARVSIRTAPMDCWACGAETEIVTGVVIAFGPHECRFSIPDLTLRPFVFRSIHGHLPKRPSIGKIKQRYSRTQERRYLSNGCAHCDALIGEFHEFEVVNDEVESTSFFIRMTSNWKQVIEEATHGALGWSVYFHE